MRRAIFVLAMAIVLVLAMSTAALAGNNKDHGTYAFGKGINAHCSLTYGEKVTYGSLVSAAKQSGHVEGAVSGAKKFAQSELFLAHCPLP